MAKKTSEVLILVGSKNDLPVVEKCAAILGELGVSCELKVASAHRSPERVETLVREHAAAGGSVVIAAAGLANHLAGAAAARTLLPVIGVPLGGSPLGGLDALLSTVQMPPGVPVATVGIGGAANAALLAARIVALRDAGVRRALADHREKMRRESTGE